MIGRKYIHKEAFCLMYYKRKKCEELEQLWNSRDGVTPFVITCKLCGGEAVHIMWQFDKCVPDYKPGPGQRIFIDMTKERAEEIAKKRIEHYNKLGYNADEDPVELLKDITEDIWHNGESPDIKTLEEDKLTDNKMKEMRKQMTDEIAKERELLKANPLLEYSTTQLKAELRRRKQNK